jgi:hypothetical protein
MTYRRVPAATDVRRPFTVVVGRSPGYDGAPNAPTGAAVAAVLVWMKDRAVAAQPYLTGVITEGSVCYAWADDQGGAGGAAEPAVVFSGDVSVLYAADVTHEEVEAMLDELGGLLGAVLDQTRVYVTYRDSAWVLEREGRTTPRTR